MQKKIELVMMVENDLQFYSAPSLDNVKPVDLAMNKAQCKRPKCRKTRRLQFRSQHLNC